MSAILFDEDLGSPEQYFTDKSILVPGEYFIIGDVPFLVRSINRIRTTTGKGGLILIDYTAQTLDTHEVYTDTAASNEFDSIKPLKEILDKKFEL